MRILTQKLSILNYGLIGAGLSLRLFRQAVKRPVGPLSTMLHRYRQRSAIVLPRLALASLDLALQHGRQTHRVPLALICRDKEYPV
jgi:hypothetical protein